MDVSVDSDSGRPAEVLFDVYDSLGTHLADFIVPTQDGFASTLSHGNLSTWRAVNRYSSARGRRQPRRTMGLRFHIDVKGARLTVGVLHTLKGDLTTPFGMGTLFSVPLGSFNRASLLVANVSGSDVGVEIFKGQMGAAGTGAPQNARLGNRGTRKVNLLRT